MMEGKTLTIPNRLNTVKRKQVMRFGTPPLHCGTPAAGNVAPGFLTKTTVDRDNKLQISGIITQDAHRIQVGLGSEIETGSEILSFYVDFRFHNDTLAFNTRENGYWGEEIVHANPYKQGDKFEVTVDCTEQNYVVMMEGKTLTIPNRLNTVKTKQIFVKSDLELHCLTLEPSN